MYVPFVRCVDGGTWLIQRQAYLQAIKVFPDLPLAYQGVTKLYTDAEQWDKLAGLLKTQVIRAVKE